MSTTITGGSVYVEDGVKAADFHPNRVVKVTINFDVPEGVSGRGALDNAAAIAHQKVRQLLHQAPEVVETLANEALSRAAGPSIEHPADAKIAELAATATERRKRRTRAEIEADEAAAAARPTATGSVQSAAASQGSSGSATSAPTGSQGQTGSTQPQSSSASSAGSVDISIGDPTPAGDVSSAVVDPSPAASSAPSSTADVLDWNAVEVATVVTDAQLNSACQAAAQGGVKPEAIKGLIASYKTKDPWFLASIPNEQRADFLAKLAAHPTWALK